MHASTHIGLKTTINQLNVNEISDLATFAKSMGASVHYQPVLADNKNAKRMMRLNMANLDLHANRLIEGIESGSLRHVTNSPGHIKTWRRYFSDQETVRSYCPTSLENLFVSADGAVRLCERYRQTVGNIYSEEILAILESDEAKALMAQTFACERNCSFIYKRGPRDYWRLFRVMSRSKSPSAPGTVHRTGRS